MKVNIDAPAGQNAISGYAPGWIRVGERRIEQPCVVTPRALRADLLPATPGELTRAHLDLLLELEPEIVLLGTGAKQRFIDFTLAAGLAARGVGLEVMDTGAACRCFNVLMAEDRAVVAALFML